MSFITEEILDQSLDTIAAMDENMINDSLADYFAKQPFIMTYIMSVTESMNSDEARNDLVFLLLVTLQCFYSINDSIIIIEEKQIEEEENKQIELMKKFDSTTDQTEQLELALSFVSTQVHLFEYISEIVEPNSEEGSNFDEADSGTAFGSLKIVADLLTTATGEAA